VDVARPDEENILRIKMNRMVVNSDINRPALTNEDLMQIMVLVGGA
jgi:hypothetical protein